VAGYQVIGAVGQAICQVLKQGAASSEFARAQFELLQSADAQPTSAKITEGVGLVLYRVAINGSRRSLPPRLGRDGIRRRPSLPIDLHYLLTFWAATPEKQHYLIGLSMRTLHESAVLAHNLINQHLPAPSRLEPDETVELVCEPHSLQDVSYLADPLRQLTTVAYVARRILIDSDISLDEFPLVQTRVFEVGAEQPA
jgi:hypothetical protein